MGLRRAKYLLADSQNTKNDLVELLRCSPERIAVIRNGIDPIFRTYSDKGKAIAHDKWGLPQDGTRRILVTGHQFYKNLTGSLQAFARLIKRYDGKLQLIKTGRVTAEWEKQVEALGLSSSAISLGFVPRESLPDIFNIADVLLFPSLYEGYGLPALEAMACGTPVVTSNVASLPEVVGNAALLRDPRDYGGLADAVYSVLTDRTLEELLIERGRSHVKKFTWERTAEETLEVYESVMGLSTKVIDSYSAHPSPKNEETLIQSWQGATASPSGTDRASQVSPRYRRQDEGAADCETDST